MEELIFNRSSSPSIGVELELQILDKDTLELAQLAPHILKRIKPSFAERIKAEFIQSMVEINTGICSTVDEVKKDLLASYAHLNDLAVNAGGELFALSLHPFSKCRAQKVSEHQRYKRILDELQMVGRRFITQGLHIHIGVTDEEEVIRVNNNLRIFLPVLLALTTSSPFFEEEDTGLMSYRAKLFEALPLAGMPDSLDGWEDFKELVALLKRSGIIDTVKDIWWDVRPHPDFGTVEIRICDLPYSMRDILAITALVQALVVTLQEQHENPEPNMQILRSNKWQAARYGIDGIFVDPFFGKRCSMKETVMNLYRYVKPASESLGSVEYLNEVPEILSRLTASHMIKKLYYNDGHSFNEIIRIMQGMFLK